MWSADTLVLFSDIDGIYTDNPKTNSNAKLIEKVDSVEDLRKNIVIGETNSFGTGGIETKIQAAQKVTEYGIEMILANGSRQNALTALLECDSRGTLFSVKN